MAAGKEQSTTIELQPGEFLLREKMPCDALYIIKEGQLEVYKTTSEGTRLPLGMVSSGQYVGETALLTNKAHSSNVVALSPVTATKISREAIDAQLKTAPVWLVALTRGLIERLHQTNEVLRRNGLVDEKLSVQLRAVEEKFKKAT